MPVDTRPAQAHNRGGGRPGVEVQLGKEWKSPDQDTLHEMTLIVAAGLERGEGKEEIVAALVTGDGWPEEAAVEFVDAVDRERREHPLPSPPEKRSFGEVFRLEILGQSNWVRAQGLLLGLVVPWISIFVLLLVGFPPWPLSYVFRWAKNRPHEADSRWTVRIAWSVLGSAIVTAIAWLGIGIAALAG